MKGISNLNNMAMFNVSGPGMKGMVGMAARVFATMSLMRHLGGVDHSIFFRVQHQFLRAAERLRTCQTGDGR